MASKRSNVQHSWRRRLLGTLGALTLAGCSASADVHSCSSQIHFKMRSDTIQLTLQWFLDDDIIDLVNFVARYSNCDQHNACNNNDGIYHTSIVRTSTRDAANGGYVRVFTIGLQL